MCKPDNPSFCLKDETVAEYASIGNFDFSYKNTASKELNRLRVGPFIGELLDNFQRALGSSYDPDRKFFVYSAHDTTTGEVLGVLHSKDMRWSPYASTIVMELFELDSRIFVRVLYNGEFLQSNVCDFSRCPFEVFSKHLKEYVLGKEILEHCKVI